eukprot:1142704-Pelagomonas_calceolata.AAC.6
MKPAARHGGFWKIYLCNNAVVVALTKTALPAGPNLCRTCAGRLTMQQNFVPKNYLRNYCRYSCAPLLPPHPLLSYIHLLSLLKAFSSAAHSWFAHPRAVPFFVHLWLLQRHVLQWRPLISAEPNNTDHAFCKLADTKWKTISMPA